MGILESSCKGIRRLLYEFYDWGFYREERIGKDGAPFMLIKFRTIPRGMTEPPVEFKASEIFRTYDNDPRLTPINTLIRKLKIDELPNLMNVLRGEMEIVNPRAIVPDEEERLPPDVARIRRMAKPGCIHPWGALRRNKYSDENRIKADMQYLWRLDTGYAPKVKLDTALRHFYNIPFDWQP